jgi:hypothetical protein
MDFGIVQLQAVPNRSEYLDEAERKEKNPDIMAENSFTDFTVENALLCY